MKSLLKSVLCLAVSAFVLTMAFGVTGAGAAKKAPKSTAVIVWNGDDLATGQGWAAPPMTNKVTKASIAPEAGVGVGGTAGLKWTAIGPEWAGFGWNWFGWWPSDAGTDVSKMTRLLFKIKIVGVSPDKLPPVDAFTVKINCSGNGQKGTDTLPIANYDAAILDGEWHDIAIPLADFYALEKSADFDKTTAWELDIGEWCQVNCNFAAYIDDIGFDAVKLKKAKKK
jgi:hypothetical protein